MLIIRNEQMHAFELNRIREFKRLLREYLNSVLPPEVDLDALIDRGLADADGFGFLSEKHVARFVEITGLHLGGFPDGPLPVAARAILMAYGMEPASKLDNYLNWAQSGRNTHA